MIAHDYVDGAPNKHKKSFGDWLDDTLLAMQVLTSVSNDELYDTDAPDLPVATQTAETYNNFRQWLEWEGRPCSNYAYWYFQAGDEQILVDGSVRAVVAALAQVRAKHGHGSEK